MTSLKTHFQVWLNDQIVLLFRIAMRIIAPVLQMLFAMLFIMILSVIVYLIAYRRWVPTAFVNKPVFFDYNVQPIVARINFGALENQWYYTHAKMKSKYRTPFMKSGGFYSVDMSVSFAKSEKNFLFGSTALTLSMIDGSGEAVARSTRPLVVPYQSPSSRFVETMSLQPLRLWGLSKTVEFTTVHVQLMNDYEEPPSHRPHTEYLEVSLLLSSPNEMDILDAHVTVLPRLQGIV